MGSTREVWFVLYEHHRLSPYLAHPKEASMALTSFISPALSIYQAYSEDMASTLPDLQPLLEQPRGLQMGCWRQTIAPLTCQVKHPQQRVAVPPN